MSITEAIELLKTYNGPLGLKLHKGASEELISKAENIYNVTFPADFKTFYRFTDGFETVEDIFNMIPLAEMIDNKESHDPLWIAEYMIYSDMWELEINPDNPEEYSIFCGDFDYGKTILTNSLADFIARFLKGGVFEIGGLYAWKDEIKAKLYGNTDPNKIKPLLWVYRECMKRGLMTKQELINRADWIIATEDEPHHFFIELSLSHDMNELITVLDSIYLESGALQIRVFFSTVYTKLLVDQITTGKAISIIESFLRDERLTSNEHAAMMDLIVEFDDLSDGMPNPKSQQQVREKVKDFFNNYSGFNLYYLKNWDQINSDLVNKFESK
jgi:hypothetical protein